MRRVRIESDSQDLLAGFDGFALLMWMNEWSFPEALQAVAHEMGMTDDRTPETRRDEKPLPRPTGPDRESVIEALNRVWQQSLDPTDRRAAPIRMYLDRRGLSGVKLDGEVVRFHPALGYWRQDDRNAMKLIGRFPAMVALVTGPDGAPVTVHRTYLTPDGRKAPMPNPKKLMGYPGNRLVGGAIRLFAPGPALGVAEGIETALAVHLRTGMPVWLSVSAGLLARLEPPAKTSLVVVWADRDRSGAGEAAALSLRERLLEHGISVAVHLPPGQSRWVRRESIGLTSGAMVPSRRLLELAEPTRSAHKDLARGSGEVFFGSSSRAAPTRSSRTVRVTRR